MISKKLINATPSKNILGKTSHIKSISLITTLGLLVSQTAFAADVATSGGIPGWVWGLLVLAILAGVMLLPKKWIDPKKKPTPAPRPTQAPIAKKVETPPVVKTITPAPVVEAVAVVPAVVETAPVTVKEEPKIEKPVEVIDALDEAKQLLAQQRFPQAVGVLNKGLQKDPARSDLMLELLAIYLKQDDHEAFDAQYEQLKQLDDPIALIQAEELHNQLERKVAVDNSIVVEDNDLIEFESKKTVIEPTETESLTPEVVTDYSVDSLAFTTEKPNKAEPEHVEPTMPDAESVSFGKTVDVTPIENEFSLDDVDLVDISEKKDSAADVSAKKPSDGLDFSEFDDFIVNAPSETKSLDITKEAEPTVVESKDLVDLKLPETEPSKTSDLVDLEFDLDDSFSFDEDKTEVSAKKSDWSTDLADETFALPTEPAFKDPFAAELEPEPVVPVPVAPPKAVEPIKKDLATTLEEEFPFLQTADTFQTRLDLARNYIALGEISSAKELLNEIAEQGAGTQQTEARELIAKLVS
jgi:pilus assembly protein FimV